MRRMCVVVLSLLFAATFGIRYVSAQDAIPTKFVTFEDMRPPQVTCMSMGYGTVGVDPNDIVYCAWCGDCSGPGNCAMFSYNPESGQKKLLGTLREVAKDANNLGPNQYWNKTETFMKGHTSLPYIKGKIYIGTQEFHAVSNALNRASNQVNYRGAHIFSYDIAAGKLVDESVSQPNGVFSPHQGILQLSGYPEKNLLVGWAIPAGDLIIYDVDTKAAYTNPGVPSEFGKDVSREIPITSKGKVFNNYQFGGLYLYDIAAKTNTKMSFTIPAGNYGGCAGDMQGVINGSVWPKDRKKIYFATYGYLYVLDSETENITFLTKQLPEGEPRNICRVWGMALSLDEKKIYWVVTTGTAAFRLYEYDIATNKVVFLKDLSSLLNKNQTYSRQTGQLSEISGDNVRDSKGRIYFVRHTYDASGGSGLLQIDVRSRLDSTFTATSTRTATSTSTGTGTTTGTGGPSLDGGGGGGFDGGIFAGDVAQRMDGLGRGDAPPGGGTSTATSVETSDALSGPSDGKPSTADARRDDTDGNRSSPVAAGENPGPSGCSCAYADGGGASAFLWAGLALALFLARRWRSSSHRS